jgi:hypothetical protein
MSFVQYKCAIIGDGLTPETAFRPAIADVIDPVLSSVKAFPAWSVVGDVPTDQKGVPTSLTCIVEVQDDTNALLVVNNPNITPVVGKA